MTVQHFSVTVARISIYAVPAPLCTCELVTQNIINIIFASHKSENNKNRLSAGTAENLIEYACALTRFKGALSHFFL